MNETRVKREQGEGREREIRMELDFNSVGVDIWFLPHVRLVVLSNYSLYSSIRWSPPVVVIGHRLLRLPCWGSPFFLSFLAARSIENVWFSRIRWRSALNMFFLLSSRGKRSIFINFSSTEKGRMRADRISIHTPIQLPRWYLEEKSRDRRRLGISQSRRIVWIGIEVDRIRHRCLWFASLFGVKYGSRLVKSISDFHEREERAKKSDRLRCLVTF